MKRILSIILIFSWCFASDFSFDPATNDIEKLRKFCSESLPKGINLDNNSNIEICKIQTKNALEFYETNCNENNANFCYLASFIYTDSGNTFKRIDSSFNNKEKAFKYRDIACNYNHTEACLVLALGYGTEFINTGNKKYEKLKQATMKKFCELTEYKNDFYCKEYRNKPWWKLW